MIKQSTEIRQKQIVNTSLELVKDGGIQNLTIKKISKNIGISEQAIYRHFDSKHMILCAIIKHFNNHFDEIFLQLKNIDNDSWMENFIDVHINYFENNHAVAAVIFSEEIFQNNSKLSSAIKDLLDRRVNLITKTIIQKQLDKVLNTTLPPRDLAYIIIGGLRFLVTNWRLSNFSFSFKESGDSLKNTYSKLII